MKFSREQHEVHMSGAENVNSIFPSDAYLYTPSVTPTVTRMATDDCRYIEKTVYSTVFMPTMHRLAESIIDTLLIDSRFIPALINAISRYYSDGVTEAVGEFFFLMSDV